MEWEGEESLLPFVESSSNQLRVSIHACMDTLCTMVGGVGGGEGRGGRGGKGRGGRGGEGRGVHGKGVRDGRKGGR